MAARDLHYVTIAECWGFLIFGLAVGRSVTFAPWYLVLAGFVVSLVIWRWWRGYCGLDQYPQPYGRFYKAWMLERTNEQDYYPWLATKMEGRDPWRLWVELEQDRR